MQNELNTWKKTATFDGPSSNESVVFFLRFLTVYAIEFSIVRSFDATLSLSPRLITQFLNEKNFI